MRFVALAGFDRLDEDMRQSDLAALLEKHGDYNQRVHV